jgi:hypothetical protein
METLTSDLTGIIIIILKISRKVTPLSHRLGQRLCVASINKPHDQNRHKNNRKAGEKKPKAERPHQNILRKNTLVESIILTSSPAFIFKNSSSVTGPTALKGNNLPSGISFQLPLVCAKAASMTSANRRPFELVTDSR